MVLCQQDRCKHFVAQTDRFEEQEIIIGYKCEEGFDIELHKARGYERNIPFCEKYERCDEAS